MSADFWAGYISGAIGIIIGNPLDVLKVRLQASPPPSPTRLPPSTPSPSPSPTSTLRPFLTGTAAPILGYGALNALLFISYNRSESALNTLFPSPSSNPSPAPRSTTGTNLYTTFLAGCLGGLATWVVSTPTELIKCRAQLSPSPTSSWAITHRVLHRSGIRGLYSGGGVTAIRDSVGYGFYFWGYELSSRIVPLGNREDNSAARVLLCGGIAGVLTWASIFPLDVIKTRVQTQVLEGRGEGEGLTGRGKRMGAWEVARQTYAQGGIRPFFRGLGVCSVRAFVVNAVQWAVYEWIMMELGAGRQKGKGNVSGGEVSMG
ncbi:mitochondrial carrier domain-containing protein [Podospora aff. communis PSN243]|uniref:Mitochondrial carrier domain-containing protein n=1 Tax=Podospora aff. communis PSN243 TaxID=3040156 RepID=A0AAV9GUR3_9PEZI|nr:mitochondrial carrier domain-containing protein [Podospora aff. communis PSN243]